MHVCDRGMKFCLLFLNVVLPHVVSLAPEPARMKKVNCLPVVDCTLNNMGIVFPIFSGCYDILQRCHYELGGGNLCWLVDRGSGLALRPRV